MSEPGTPTTPSTTPTTPGPSTPAVARDPAEPTVTITVRDDAFYRVVGPVRILDAEGNAFDIEPGRPVFLCRCGRSETKPFCDSSHRRVGFESRPRAAARAEA